MRDACVSTQLQSKVPDIHLFELYFNINMHIPKQNIGATKTITATTTTTTNIPVHQEEQQMTLWR